MPKVMVQISTLRRVETHNAAVTANTTPPENSYSSSNTPVNQRPHKFRGNWTPQHGHRPHSSACTDLAHKVQISCLFSSVSTSTPKNTQVPCERQLIRINCLAPRLAFQTQTANPTSWPPPLFRRPSAAISRTVQPAQMAGHPCNAGTK